MTDINDIVTPSDKLAAAKIWAWNIRPYFAAGYNAMHPIEKPGLGTMAVDDRWNLYYDPEIFDKWSITDVSSVLYHELCHLLRRHAPRSKVFGSSFDHMIWNVAADCEINGTIAEEMKQLGKGEALPGEACFPEKFGLPNGELAEWYYEKLREMSAKMPKDPDAGSGSCGSCAHGDKEDHEEANTANSGLTEPDGQLVIHQVAQDIKDHQTKKRGTVPGGWDRWADSIIKPKVNYMRWIRMACRNAIQEAEGKVDYSWNKRHRLQGAFGKFIMPGLTGHRAKIGFGIDTSGSMSEKQIGQCLGEIHGALRDMGHQKLVVASCDAAVHSLQTVTSVKQLKIKGGGGTDMGVAIAQLDSLRPRLNVIILLTDCETPWPAEPPKAQLVVVKVAGSGAPPPWRCHLIEIDLNEI
jgi:predicted metal-dependent peptidase